MYGVSQFIVAKIWNQLKCHQQMNRLRYMLYTDSWILFSHTKQKEDAIFSKVDGTGRNHVNWHKPNTE